MKTSPTSRFTRRLLFICLMVSFSFYNAFSQKYFQQEVNYKITVSLNDTLHELHAFEQIEYINNAPHSLPFIYFHLWPNAYSNNNTHLAKQLFRLNGRSKLFDDPELRGFIDSLDFKVNGSQVQWHLLPDQPDNCRVDLNNPLLPGDTIHISTPFHVKIPKGVTSRLGHIGESYQILQWYPKPAVYDQEGWHPMSYLNQGEFYSEFGSFDVKITLPDNYIVGATGLLQNQGELEMLEKRAADTSWMNASHIGKVPFPASSEQLKTIHYTAHNVHDFAWFADKRYHVMKGNVILPGSGRKITTWVMFTNRQSNLWENALDYVNDAILWASEKTGDYPYESFTAVQSALSAGYGMEYPGITVIGMVEDEYALHEVLSHEIFHNWFYGALASNERKYPFMDEGITSAYTARYMKEKYPLKKFWQVYFKNWRLARFLNIDQLPVEQMQELEWLVQARSNLEQPMNLPADKYSDMNYGIILYNKAAISFNYLRTYLGDSIFDGAMQEYYRNWIFRHPQPYDLQTVFEQRSDKNLDWFFTDLLGTTKRIDYKIVRKNKNQLLVKNKGEMHSPLLVAGMNGDSMIFEKWVDGFAGRQLIELPEGDYSEINIDPGHTMTEIFRINNNIRTTGVLPKIDPIQPQLLFTIEDPEKHTLIFLPLINWTRENGFMAGLALNNGFIVPKRVEYFIMPFYAFGNNDLAGFGRIAYRITPYENFIRQASIFIEGTQFGAPGNQNYQKAKTGVDLLLKNRNMSTPVTQQLYANYTAAFGLNQNDIQATTIMNSYIRFGYRLDRHGFINPFTLQTGFESGKSYQKISAEFNYKLSYHGKENGLDVRLFAGTMLKEDDETSFYSLSPSGRSGRELYLYEGSYPDRFVVFPTSFWSRQMSLSEGGLVSPVNDSLGYSRWLVSLSLASSLPGKSSRLPVKPFVNLLVNDPGLGGNTDSPIFFEAGLKMGIGNFFEIYVPLMVSRNISSTIGLFKNRIRFVFSLSTFSKKRFISKQEL